jgi:ribonuclease III
MKHTDFMMNIQYSFKDQTLLKKALTHPSSLRSYKVSHFERLEFLGDRVLGLVIADMIYQRYPDEKEGDLAKRFAALVCREACLEVANEIQIGDFLKASLVDMAPHSVILGDAVEALIGAIYLDGGLESAAAFVNRYWPALLEKDIRPPKDAKTTLQELAQSTSLGSAPAYEVLEHSGPAHTPTFKVRVLVIGLGEAVGTGNSKRQAEQMAAKRLLEEINR